jgi:hypothetical protein
MSSYVELYIAAPKTTSPIPNHGMENPQPTSEMIIGPDAMLGSAWSPYSDDRRESGGHVSAKRFFNRLLGDATAAPQVGPLDMTEIIPATSPGE